MCSIIWQKLRHALPGKKEGVEYMEEAFRIAVPSDSMMVRLYDGLVECYDYAGGYKERGGSLGEVIYFIQRKTPFFIK